MKWWYEQTLWETDEMDAVFGVLHDGSNYLSETINLLPQRLQAGHVIIHVYCSHISTWVSLKNSEKEKMQSFILNWKVKKQNWQMAEV